MSDYLKILEDLKNRQFKPIYVLYGDEPYFIDVVSNYIENHILDDSEKGFNQVVLYGKEVTMSEIVENAKRFPMMAEYQVIIVKEAQHLVKQWALLENYVAQPQPTTILVFNYKYKKPDARLKVFKEMKKIGVLMESKPLYENKVADWITSHLKNYSLNIEPIAAQLMVEFLGNDLSRIVNELKKLQIVLKEGTTITPQTIEDHIGISKDYNNFELRRALGNRDTIKVHKIINYFGNNPKDNPLILTTGLLYSFFTQLLKVHALEDKSPNSIAKATGTNPFFTGEILTASKNYPMKYCSRAINSLRKADLQAKGLHTHHVNDGDILKELMVNIMAP